MKLIAFCYDFPHRKSALGLGLLAKRPELSPLIWCAPFVQIGESSPPDKSEYNASTSTMARALGFEYLVDAHDSDDALNFVRRYSPQVGIVFGARILPPKTLAEISGPVINFHPGVLPTNRGLDCMKWGIVNSWPQGVSVHAIGDCIDAGTILKTYVMGCLQSAQTLGEIGEVLRAIHDKVVVSTIDVIEHLDEGYTLSENELGEYHSCFPNYLMLRCENSLYDYLKNYSSIVNDWRASVSNVLPQRNIELII